MVQAFHRIFQASKVAPRYRHNKTNRKPNLKLKLMLLSMGRRLNVGIIEADHFIVQFTGYHVEIHIAKEWSWYDTEFSSRVSHDLSAKRNQFQTVDKKKGRITFT